MQGTCRTGLLVFWDIGNWSWHRGEIKNDSSVNFKISGFFLGTVPYVFYHLHVISDWFSNIFPQKNYAFLQPLISKTIGIGSFKGWFLEIALPDKPLLCINGHISKSIKEYELDFGIKLKLKVCSLKWYQTLILPKMLLVPRFVGVPGIGLCHVIHLCHAL